MSLQLRERNTDSNSVCLSLCLSVTLLYCAKTTEPITKQSILHSRLAIRVFPNQRSMGVIPMRSSKTGAPTAGGVTKIVDFRQISCYVSETVQDRDIITIEGY